MYVCMYVCDVCVCVCVCVCCNNKIGETCMTGMKVASLCGEDEDWGATSPPNTPSIRFWINSGDCNEVKGEVEYVCGNFNNADGLDLYQCANTAATATNPSADNYYYTWVGLFILSIFFALFCFLFF